MPIGNDPPDVLVSEDLFDDINNLSYSSSDDAFKNDQTGILYYLYVQYETGSLYKNEAVLDTSTAKSSNANPWGKIPQFTADVFHGGSYDSGTNTVSYQGKDYRFRLEWDDGNSENLIVAREY